MTDTSLHVTTIYRVADIRLRGDATYRENTIVDNENGAVNSGVNLGDNYCSGFGVISSSCP